MPPVLSWLYSRFDLAALSAGRKIKPNAEKMHSTCQAVKDAVLLVYLVDGEKDIYISVRPLPPRACPAGLSPAESFSYLGVAESLRTGK
jgi:hypothetical protein